MNFRLVALTMASSVFVIVYTFGDAIKYLGHSGNLDQILSPMLGSFGWYLFEVTVPFATIVLIFFSLREAYNEGKRDAEKDS
jgi:hypothetical protein